MRKRQIIKPIIGLLTCSVLLSALYGCGGENKNQKNTSSSQSSTSESTASATEPQKEYVIKNAIDFSDGLAWVFITDTTLTEKSAKQSNDGYETACINQSGEIQFVLDKNNYTYVDQLNMWGYDRFIHEWHNGTSIIGHTSNVKSLGNLDTLRIYDQKGNIIFEADDTYTNILCYADNYYAILKEEKSIDKNEHHVCFLNTDGSWQSKEWNLNTSSNNPSVEYLGEGMFYYEPTETFYNINTNQTFTVKDYDAGLVRGKFSNGKLIMAKVTKTRILDTNGNLSNEPIDTHYYMHTTGFNGRYAALFNNEKNDCFLKAYDSQTDTITEVAAFSNGIIFTSEDYQFDGDKIVVGLNGIDNKKYFVTYTFDGNQLFEPIQCDEIIGASCNRITIKKNNAYYVYDYSGNMVFDDGKASYKGWTFNQYSDNTCIINRSVNNLYLDTNGNTLFDKITNQNKEYIITQN